MRKKINNRDITKEFLSEQYHHDTPDEVIEDVVNFLIERLYKFDPPQEILDSVQNQAALTPRSPIFDFAFGPGGNQSIFGIPPPADDEEGVVSWWKKGCEEKLSKQQGIQ